MSSWKFEVRPDGLYGLYLMGLFIKYKAKVYEGPFTDSIYIFTVDSNSERKRIEKRLTKKEFKYKCCQTEWTRSNHYRETFMRNNPLPLRCRYCNKKLKKPKDVEVDHLIPVSKAKNSNFIRWRLKVRGIDNINSQKNLVASCKKCNRRKADKMGLWYIRGVLGKYKLYWVTQWGVALAFGGIIAKKTIYLFVETSVGTQLLAFSRAVIEGFTQFSKLFT